MRRSSVGRTFIFPLLVIAVGLLGGCNEPELRSVRVDREIRIDGEPSDWRGIPIYHHENAGAAIAVANDGRDLYLRLSTGDRGLQKQILAGGLTVWLDPHGGKERYFGIRFPLGLNKGGRNSKAADSRKSGDRPSQLRGESNLELLGPGQDERQVLSADRAGELGFEVKWQKITNVLVYELKAPLAGGEGVSIGGNGAPGPTIGIGFVGGDMVPAGKVRAGGAGERRGMGGGRGGTKGGGRSPGGVPRSEPLELWTKITLASEPSGIGGGE